MAGAATGSAVVSGTAGASGAGVGVAGVGLGEAPSAGGVCGDGVPPVAGSGAVVAGAGAVVAGAGTVVAGAGAVVAGGVLLLTVQASWL